MTEEEFYTLINQKIGYQGYVQVTQKPLPQPQPVSNPFHGTPSELGRWIVTKYEVGLTTPFGQIPMGDGITVDLCIEDLKKNHPYLIP